MPVRRTRLLLAAAGAALLIALSGCGADSADKNASTGSGDRGLVAPAAGAPQEGGAGDAGAGPVKAPGKIPDNLDADQRSIIYSGTMTVRVDDVDAAAARAISYATAAGGFVGGDNRQRDARKSQGVLVLRIPAAKFAATLDQLKGLGDEKDRTVTAQDVTDQVVDVDARLQNAQASVDRIRALLAKANTISEITSVESELSRREADLESLQARKRKLDGLTALSTVSLTLLGPEAAVVASETGLAAGFHNGLNAFLVSLRVALTVLGWLIPWLVLLGLPIWLLVRLVRRFRPAPSQTPARPAPLPTVYPGGPLTPVGAPGRPAPVPAPGADLGPVRGPVPPARPVSGPVPVPGPVRGPVSGPPASGAAASGAASPGAASPGSADSSPSVEGER